MKSPNLAWLGAHGLQDLDQILNATTAHNQREKVREVLAPLLNDLPADDVDWLRNLETALREVTPATTGPLTDLFRRLVRDHRWRELIDAVARGWPDHPEPLRASDVLRRLERLAAQVTGRLPTIRRQVIDDAPGVIVRAFRKFHRCRPFNPWARRVLHNHAVSLYRRERRTLLSCNYLHELASPFRSLAEDDLAEVLRDFRRLCDLVRFPGRKANGPKLAVVFALETRLRLLDDLVRCGPDFLNSHLPLRDWERALQARRGWPTLGELWERLAEPAELGLRNIEAIRRACRSLAPNLAVEGLHKVWNTWLARAKDAVACQLRSSTQAQLFFYLFPIHRPVEAAAGRIGPKRQGSAS